MIHYCCDRCRRPIDPNREDHYVVKVEVHLALDEFCDDGIDDDRDHLAELHDMIEAIDDVVNDEPTAQAPRLLRLDLCAECRHEWLQNPLGSDRARHMNFSQN